MVEVGIDDFSLKDIIRPEAPRLKVVLSALINFAKFREEQLSVFEDFSRKSEELIEQRSKYTSREAELIAKITYFKYAIFYDSIFILVGSVGWRKSHRF